MVHKVRRFSQFPPLPVPDCDGPRTYTPVLNAARLIYLTPISQRISELNITTGYLWGIWDLKRTRTEIGAYLAFNTVE